MCHLVIVNIFSNKLFRPYREENIFTKVPFLLSTGKDGGFKRLIVPFFGFACKKSKNLPCL